METKGFNNSNGNNTPNIKGIIFRVLSKWYLFILGVAIAIGIAKIYLRYQDNIFNVSSTLHFKTGSNNTYRNLGGMDLFASRTSLGDEIHVIRSFDMISKVIKELDFDVSYFHQGDIRRVEFYKNAPFRVVLDTSSYQLAGFPFNITILNGNEYRIQANFGSADIVDVTRNTIEGKAKGGSINKVLKFGEPFKMENLAFTIYLADPYYKQPVGQLFFYINNPEHLSNNYKNRLSISPIYKGSNILKLSVSGPLVEKDIDFLNMAMQVYIRDGLENKNTIATNTISFIDSQLEKISDSLRRNERQIEDFRTRFNYKGSQQGLDKAVDKLDQLESEKAEMFMKLEYYQYVLDYIKNNKDLKQIVAPSSIGIEDGILSGLIKDLILLQTEKAILTESTSDKNPYIKDLDKKIKTTTETLYENVHNILKVSNIPIKNINGRIHEIEKSLSSLPEKDRLWLDIQRKFNLNNHLYNFLLERRAEAGITKASTKPDHEVVEKASWRSAHQVAPNTGSVYNLAVLLGLLVPLALVMGLEYLNDKIQSKEDLLNRTNIPILGVIGHKNMSSNLVVAEKPKSGIAEAFRSVRMNLSYLASQKKSKVIVISSSVSGEGKTFFSVNLSNIIAVSNKKTLLIGGDLRKPKIYDDFNLSNLKGLSTYLSHKASLKEIINKTDIENFDIITSGPIPPNPAELLGSEMMVDLLQELKNIYEYIIIDTPPIGLVADGFDLMKHADINLYIVRHKYTRYKMLERINLINEEGKAKNLGIIINDLNINDAKYYGYGNSYGYYYASGYYEQDEEKKSFVKRVREKIKI